MMTLQAKAPFVNGLLVYMGATDRNMVLLQPDFDIPTKDDWVLLDSMFRTNDYDYDAQYYEKILSDSRNPIDAMPYINRDRITVNYCIPTWMWMLPLLLLVLFIWINYSNYIYNAFIHEGLQQEFGLSNANHFNGIAMSSTTAADKKYFGIQDEFVVGSDFYFYPSPAIPPPKYNEINESVLLGSSDDEDENASHSRSHCPNAVTTKNSSNDCKSNSIVDT